MSDFYPLFLTRLYVRIFNVINCYSFVPVLPPPVCSGESLLLLRLSGAAPFIPATAAVMIPLDLNGLCGGGGGAKLWHPSHFIEVSTTVFWSSLYVGKSFLKESELNSLPLPFPLLLPMEESCSSWRREMEFSPASLCGSWSSRIWRWHLHLFRKGRSGMKKGWNT